MIQHELGKLYDRDISKIASEITKFRSEENLWKSLPGVINPAGNLCLHLAGNLQTYIGRNIGGFPYVRERDAEFALKGIAKAELISKVEHTRQVVLDTLIKLDVAQLEKPHVENVFGYEMTNSYFLFHLLAHLSYHTGQINYIRRILEP